MSLYDNIRTQSYAIKASTGWKAAVMYLVLVVLLYKFLFRYIKRFAVITVLTLLAPIMGIGYAIDKIKDNKSQYLNNWVKEYVINVLIQVVHALLYTVFVTLAFDMIGTSIMGALMAILLISFMFKAEGIFKKIFGIKAETLKDLSEKTTAGAIGVGVAVQALKKNAEALDFVTKPIRNAVDKAGINKITAKLDEQESREQEIKHLQNDLIRSNEKIQQYENDEKEGIDREIELTLENVTNREINSKIENLETVNINGTKIKNSDLRDIKDILGEDATNKDIAKVLYSQTGGNKLDKTVTGINKFKGKVSSIPGQIGAYKDEKRRLKLEAISLGKRTFKRATGEAALSLATAGIYDAIITSERIEQDARARQSKISEPTIKYEPIFDYLPEENSKAQNDTVTVVLERGIKDEYKQLKTEKITKKEVDVIVEDSFNVLSERAIKKTIKENINIQNESLKENTGENKKVKLTRKDLENSINKIEEDCEFYINGDKLQKHVDKLLKDNISKKNNVDVKNITENDMDEEIQRIGIDGIATLIKMASLNNDCVMTNEQLSKKEYKKLLRKIEKLKKQKFISEKTNK